MNLKTFFTDFKAGLCFIAHYPLHRKTPLIEQQGQSNKALLYLMSTIAHAGFSTNNAVMGLLTIAQSQTETSLFAEETSPNFDMPTAHYPAMPAPEER